MEQEYAKRETPVEPLSDFAMPDERDATLADRLTLEQVDTIIRRAIALQLNEDPVADTLDEAAVERVANEIGIDPVHVRRAISEYRADPDPIVVGFFDRLLIPPRIREHGVVAGDRRAVETAIIDWMQQHQGMRLRSRSVEGGQWEKDTHLLTKLRMGLNLGMGDKMLRDAKNVTHRVQALGPGEHDVALQAETRWAKRLGQTLLGVGAGVGATTLVAAAADGNIGALEAAAALGGASAIWAGTLIGLKLYARNLRRAMQRALDGFRHPDLTDDGIPGRIDRLRRDWTGRRRRPV